MAQKLVRRSFLSTGLGVAAGGAAWTAASYARILGANERVRVGFIGYGLIGKRHVLDFQKQPDAQLVAVAEAHAGRLAEAVATIGSSAQGYRDFRRLLDRSDIDAVVISTPDHWHALMTVLASAAEKDVYVEKPLTRFVAEGRWMLQAAQRYRRVVQVGTQQRSGPHYQRARQLMQDGRIGAVVSVRMYATRNIMPGYGQLPDGDPPPELDWDMWLGPSPWRPYNPLRAIYHFRWFWDYSGGQMTNLGQHSLDIVDWVLGLNTLRGVTSFGGRFQLRDGGETPDTQDALFQLDHWTASWCHREVSQGRRSAYPLEFYGTCGSLGISRSGFQLTADPDIHPANTVPQFAGAHPVGGPQPVPQRGGQRLRTQPLVDQSGDGRAQFEGHVRDFLDCIKSRAAPRSDLASGHRTATACHLANISLRLGRSIRWDAQRESILDDAEANQRLTQPYRPPWDRELQSVLS